MIAIGLSPIYLIVNIYLFLRIVSWLSLLHPICKTHIFQIGFGIAYGFFIFSILIAFLLPAGKLQRFMKLMSNYWLGILLYLIFVLGIVLILGYILGNIPLFQSMIASRMLQIIVGLFCMLCVISISFMGIYQARNIQTTPYKITVHKKVKNMDSINVMLIADLHLGYNVGVFQMKQMVEKINQQQPDIIVIAGDIFDNEYQALEEPEELIGILKNMKSKYGVYAVYGNHDIDEKILAGFTFSKHGKKVSDPRMDAFLKKANIKLLRDEAVLVDHKFYLYGRPDAERLGRGIQKRKTPQELTSNLDTSKPMIVIDHEPKELQALSDAGVDVDLCGHTHAGQMFPGNIFIKWGWENPYGYIKKGNMHNIVTSGVGVFGPNMRVGTIAEICPIRIYFD